MEAKDRDTWQQADALFGELMEFPREERQRRLDGLELPGAVRKRVQRMLDALTETSVSILDHPERVGSMLEADALSGRRLGRWRLEGEIGRGGMAVVYRATSIEGPEGQPAAVKVLTLGTLAGQGSRQFLREQESLLRLRHPYIVPLLDAGVADDGTPWLAMGLVEGERVDDWCDRHALGPRARVKLVLQVCEALAHAHRNLVIHRDIKPSNVLVDEDGRIRLLDFGIAHAVDASAEATATATALRALTPGYASPEQLAGEAPSTSMDVYGLGALLYRLLTGKAPGNAGSRQPGDDLAVVVQKALSDASERYPSVEALADDLGRWLDGKPVQARRPTPGYRLRKFVARNKLPVAAVGLLALVLIAGVGATLWQAGIAHDAARRAMQSAEQHRLAQERAEHALARSNAIRDFMFELFRNEIPTGPREEMPTTAELLSAAVASVDERFPDDPQIRADFLSTIAIVYRERRMPGETEMWRKVLDLRALARESAPVDYAVAQSQLAYSLLPAGQEESEALQVAAIASLEEHAPDSIELARAFLRRANLDMMRHDGPSRARHLQQAWDIVSRLENVSEGERLHVLANLAVGYHVTGKLELAIARYSDALRSARELRGDVHVTVANLLGNRGGVFSSLGRFDEARADLEASLAQYASIYDSPNEYVLASLRERELVETRQGNFAAALPWRDKWDGAVASQSLQRPLAAAKSAIWRAGTLALLGRREQALELAGTGLETLEADPDLARRQAYNRLLAYNAKLRASCKAPGLPARDVEADIAAVLELAREEHSLRKSSSAEGYALAGLCRLRAGHAAEALALFDMAREAASGLPPGVAAVVAENLLWRGQALSVTGRGQDAIAAWRRGTEVLRESGLDRHPLHARLQGRLQDAAG